MNWEAFGAVGEIAGAIGVIVSLVYLASEIKNQNTESQVTAVNNLTYQWNAFMGDMAGNSELARIWAKGLNDFDSLNSTEYVQFSTHLNRICEGMYHQHESGRLGDKVWRGVANSISDLCCCPGVKKWWPTRSHWYSVDFESYITPLIESSAPPVINYHDRSADVSDVSDVRTP